jgi:TPR repeat protein
MNHYPCAIISLLLGASSLISAESNAPATGNLQPDSSANDAAAQYQLACAHLRGDRVPKDAQKAFALMKAAADQGHPDATGGVGHFYRVGAVVPKDQIQAAEWFRKGANMGSAKAQLNLGRCLLDEKFDSVQNPEMRRTEALQWIQKAVDQKLPEAALAYGQIFYFGDHGVKKDYAAALPYLEFSAEQGSAVAQNLMGLIYDQGLIGAVNEQMAVQWFRKAALQGNIKAQANLGRVLGPASTNKEIRLEAFAWLVIASEQGEVTAQKTIAEEAIGLPEGDYEAAKKQALDLKKLIHKNTP